MRVRFRVRVGVGVGVRDRVGVAVDVGVTVNIAKRSIQFSNPMRVFDKFDIYHFLIKARNIVCKI